MPITFAPESQHRTALLAQIKAKAVVHGKVTLSSGQEADFYIDLRRVGLDGSVAPLVGRVMLETVRGLEFDAVGGRRVQHRRGDRVGAESQTADRVEVQVTDQIQHDPADQRGSPVVQGHPAQIDVRVRLTTGGEHYPAAHNSEINNEFAQVVAV